MKNLIIPNDLILFLSGTSCVGKTSVAHQLLKIVPEFRTVSEMDIIRTVARSILGDINIISDKLNPKYSPLFKSTKDGDYNIFKQQAAFFVESVRAIVKRQQSRKIPTIIEGINIIPSLYFIDNHPIDGFNHHVLFVNLYLSDEIEHCKRRAQRCKERGYPDNSEDILKKVIKIRKNKNEELHQECCSLGKIVNNVFSIDTVDKTIDELAQQIIYIISKIY